MSSILSTLQYWLVNHPKIIHFSWTPGETLGSTSQFLVITVLTYLFLVFILTHISLPSSSSFSSLGPHIIKSITAVHSFTLFVLSFIMVLGCILSFISHHPPHLHHIVCLPPHTPQSGPLFFWAYIFYLSKILEFIDTLLIILSNSIKRLTFLHIYHHAMVVIVCYSWIHTSQSLFAVALVTNGLVHVIMYYYYLSCAMGVRPKWKRLVTDCQIIQFVFGFAISGLMLYYHFTGLGCSGGLLGLSFNLAFNASLLVLFLDFHGKSYAQKSIDDKHKQL